jgi:hypothetical protein
LATLASVFIEHGAITDVAHVVDDVSKAVEVRTRKTELLRSGNCAGRRHDQMRLVRAEPAQGRQQSHADDCPTRTRNADDDPFTRLR